MPSFQPQVLLGFSQGLFENNVVTQPNQTKIVPAFQISKGIVQLEDPFKFVLNRTSFVPVKLRVPFTEDLHGGIENVVGQEKFSPRVKPNHSLDVSRIFNPVL